MLEFTVSTIIHIKCTKLDIKPTLNDVKKVYIGYPVQLKEEWIPPNSDLKMDLRIPLKLGFTYSWMINTKKLVPGP